MAIRDQSYTRYTGPLRDKNTWIVIGWTGFRTYLRFWRTRLTFLAVWLVPLIYALIIVAEYAMRSQLAQFGENEGPTFAGITFFLQIQVFSLALVYAANGCGIIADDLRHKTIQLYFSKPITRLEYAAGKYLTLLIQGGLAVVIPVVLLGMMRTAFYVQTDHFAEVAAMQAKSVFMAALLVAVMSALVIGLSSLTRRTSFAVLSWIGLLMVPFIVHIIIAVASGGSPLAALWSVPGNIGLASNALLGGAEHFPDVVPIFAPFAILTALIVAGLGALYWRISKLDGIA